jgi:uncharacterized protein (DUF849 family)
VNAALTGQVLTPERAPHLPVTPEAIAADAEECVAAGATILHLHARDEAGRPDWRPDTYRRVIEAVRERCPDAILCVSTSGRDESDIDRRAAVLGLTGDHRPDMASLTLGSFNFHTGPSVNSPDAIRRLASRMAEAGIRPELELFDLGMAHLAHGLLAQGLLVGPLYANLMLGFGNGCPADAKSLVALVDALPGGTTWAAAGLGSYQRTANALAVAMGGHVRTGLEDNPDLDDVTRAPARNVQLVCRATQLADAVGRPVAACSQARHVLGLPAIAVAR